MEIENARNTNLIRFGIFDLDIESCELRRNGIRIHLQEQPFQILQELLLRPGRLVTRETLREKLWPQGTVVEFDHGLNTAVKKLRDALGDSARNPRYIETVPRRGYRFIGPVEISASDGSQHPAPFSARPSGGLWAKYWKGAALASVGAIVLLTMSARFVRDGSPTASAPRLLPGVLLTSFPGQEREPSLSPDGEQVAFVWGGERGSNFDVYRKPVAGGSPVRLTSDPAEECCPTWSPDGQQLAFLRPGPTYAGVFVIPSSGGPERMLVQLSVRSHAMSWSPDGKFLAVEDRGAVGEPEGIFLVSVRTGQKSLLTLPEAPYISDRWPAFSADGRTLAFCRGSTDFAIHTLPLSADGNPEGPPRRLTRNSFYVSGIDWTVDGRSLIFGAVIQTGTWRLWPIDAETELGEPEVLMVEGPSALQPTVARRRRGSNGRLAYITHSDDNNIYRIAGPAATAEVPRVPERILPSTSYDYNPQFSPTGERIAFVSDRSGSAEVWVANSDGSSPVKITSVSMPGLGGPKWSPDSRYISFDASPEGNADVFVVSSDGGVPRRLTTSKANEGAASWSRDGRWIYFTSDTKGPPEIWKMPPEGGTPVQVTSNRGHQAFESADGKWVYFAKHFAGRGEKGIWRIPAGGGEEEKVLEEGMSGSWTLSRSGIYLLDPGGYDHVPVIKRFPFGGREGTAVIEFERPSRFGIFNNLSVSPDDGSLVYVQYDQTEADLMLAENFR